jgi:hypothetical protein
LRVSIQARALHNADGRQVCLPSTLQSQWASTPQAPDCATLVLSEPDYFVHGRKPLAKSGSASRRHPVHGQHRHELPSLTLQGLALSPGRGQPRCSTPAIVFALCDAEEWMNGVGPPQRYDAQHQEFT